LARTGVDEAGADIAHVAAGVSMVRDGDREAGITRNPGWRGRLEADS